MRRFVTLAVLLLFTIPFGVSISGCSKASTVTYCNGQNSGVQVGQTVSLDLEPRLTGVSINQGAIGSIAAPTGKDCKGSSASTSGAVYASTDRTLIDVNPATGSGGLCAGTWNRSTGGGIPDYTVCTPNGKQGIAYITASAQGVVSNPVAVYVHPVVTSIILGTASTDCTADPASNCFAPNTSVPVSGAPAAVTSYDGTSCLSQGGAAQLAARTYAGTSGLTRANNISLVVGPITFSAQNTSVVTIDANGQAVATQPGSTIINAAIAQSSSTTGFFSTCPPASIVLTTPNSTTPPAAALNVSQNVTQALVANVIDTVGNPITNVALQYVSTDPRTIPTSLNDITPTFPGAAAVTAVCQPATCNSSPYNLIGLYGNGTPVTSNPVQIISNGTNNSTVLYVASTASQYILPIDFTSNTQAAPVRLPYQPNSLVLSEDGNTIYMGTANEIITYSTVTNAVTKEDTTLSGQVLAVSPDNSTVVITDPVRKLTYLYTSAGAISTQYGGTGTRAQFSNDSNTVYVATDDSRMLVHSAFTGWTSVNLPSVATDLAPTVPNAGVYLAGDPVDVHTNCPATTINGTGLSQTTTNAFYPEVGPVAGATAQRLASTNDGLHVIAASNTALTDIVTNRKAGACPITFTSTPGAPIPLTAAVPTQVTNVLPTSDSAFAFLTYTGTGGVVPQYAPATGLLTNIALQATSLGAPVAPVSGVVSSDNQTLYVGTTGDNLVHRLTRSATGFTDTLTPINPILPAFSGTGFATPNLLAQRPRKATS